MISVPIPVLTKNTGHTSIGNISKIKTKIILSSNAISLLPRIFPTNHTIIITITTPHIFSGKLSVVHPSDSVFCTPMFSKWLLTIKETPDKNAKHASHKGQLLVFQSKTEITAINITKRKNIITKP